jgi:hypothetical protein
MLLWGFPAPARLAMSVAERLRSVSQSYTDARLERGPQSHHCKLMADVETNHVLDELGYQTKEIDLKPLFR